MSNQFFRSLIAAVIPYVRNLKRSIHTHRNLYGTHYETLKLPRNCTTKDVRDSFIKLSKQYHPDKNQNDPSKHSQFVKLNEAYHILSRPDKRREYDLSLKPFSTGKSHYRQQPFGAYTTENQERVVWRDESFWEYQDKKYKDYGRTEDYYGIRGVRRLPNGLIALLCIILSAAGIFVQIALIRESNTFNRRKLDERSQEASRLLAVAQEKAAKYGNKVQVERITESMKASQTNGFSRKERTQEGKKPDDKRDIDSGPRPLVCAHVVSEPSRVVLSDMDGEMALDYSTNPDSCRRNV